MTSQTFERFLPFVSAFIWGIRVCLASSRKGLGFGGDHRLGQAIWKRRTSHQRSSANQNWNPSHLPKTEGFISSKTQRKKQWRSTSNLSKSIHLMGFWTFSQPQLWPFEVKLVESFATKACTNYAVPPRFSFRCHVFCWIAPWEGLSYK